MALDYNTLLEEYSAEFAPQNCHERFLTQQMSHASWKLSHLQIMEARLFEEFLAEPSAAVRDAQSVRLATIQRLVAAAERSYHQAHRELQATRRGTQKQEALDINSLIESFCQPPTATTPLLSPARMDEPQAARVLITAAKAASSLRKMRKMAGGR